MAKLLTNDTLDVIEALDQAPSVLKVVEIFRNVVAPHGVTAFFCSAPPRPDERPTDPILFDAWPFDWLNRYVEKEYVWRDPMVRTMYQTVHPFTGDEAMKRRKCSRIELTIMGEARECRMGEGSSCRSIASEGKPMPSRWAVRSSRWTPSHGPEFT